MLQRTQGFRIIGHRGYGPTDISIKSLENNNLLPENSLAAFKYAFDHGADGIECDVFLSADGVPMVIHDDEIWLHAAPEFAPALQNHYVSKMTAAAIGAVDIGYGHRIPALADLFTLAFTYDRRMILNLDIKDTTCVAAVCDLMQQHAAALAAHDVIVSSYNWDILRDFRARDKNVMLVPAIKSKILFGAENLGPGYVPLVDHYRDGAKAELEALHAEITISAYDTTTTDFKPALGVWAAAAGIGLQISTANSRVDAGSSDYTVLHHLKELADSGTVPYVAVKVDEPDKIRAAIEG
ncbi:MAG: glycerophosphodiester phosphodiesterase family protein [Bdellovibrionales bacterium]|jgi:glycerophosphoryl diester phosphodiesterase|nr:glycerophosphodiester phosphodiesterase family protein [Bdellovibrionales bacterium]